MGMKDLCLPLGDELNTLKRGVIRKSTVFIINGHKEEQDSLQQMIASAGWASKGYSSAESFLDEFNPSQPGCVLLDAEVPEMGGLLLQQELRSKNSLLPILFTSSEGTVEDAVQALHRGAVDFLMKPLKKTVLLKRLSQCIEKNREDRKVQGEWKKFTTKVRHLTPREHQVMELIIKGRLNKVIAFDLDISIKTVEIHRAQVMRKLQIKNQAELIKLSLFFSSKGGTQLSSLR
jgi:FixJ family two-component response regulator